VFLCIGAAALVVLGTSSAAASSFAPPTANETRRQRIDALVVDSRIEDRAAIEDALRVRMVDRPVSHSAAARAPRKGELFGYLEIERADAERASLRLLLSDGRAYAREIEAPANARAREIAATIANLVVGIEEGAIAPTAEHVALPPALRPAPVKPPSKPRTSRPRPPAGPQWGLVASGAAILAVGPPAPQGFAAGAGELRGEVRWPRGLTAGLGLRIAGNRARDYGLVRIRLAPGVGYAYRRGAFELHVLGAITVEPWLALQDGSVADSADRRPTHVLLGGALRLEPVGRIRLANERSLRIGPFVELAGSAVPSRDGGVARVRVRDEAGMLDDLFRAGGFEIAVGLVLGPWIPIR